MGGNQIEPPRLPRLLFMFLCGDQKKRRQRHDLPGKQESDRIRCQNDQCQRCNEKPIAEPQSLSRSWMFLLTPITQSINRAGCSYYADGKHKKGAEGIEAIVQCQTRERPAKRYAGARANGERGQRYRDAQAASSDGHNGSASLTGQAASACEDSRQAAGGQK